MALISLRSRSHVKASMILMVADHLFIHNYKDDLYNLYDFLNMNYYTTLLTIKYI